MIGIIIPLTLMAVVASGVAAVAIYLKRQNQHHETVSLARRLDLSMDGETARGEWLGHPVEARIHQDRYRGLEVLLRVGGADPRFDIRRERWKLFRRFPPPPGPFLPSSMSAGYREPDDIITGDRDFDERIRVKGPVGVGVGILDRETRRLVQAVDALGDDLEEGLSGLGDAHVADGWVVLRQRDLRLYPENDVCAWLRLMVELAEALARRGRARPLDNLLENFRTERDPEVRRVNLACLGTYYPQDPETLAASREALEDPENDWIRLQGAVNLRREGWPALGAMAADATRLDGVRAAALRALGLSLPREEAEALLWAHLPSDVPALALSALETLGDIARTAEAALRLDRWAESRGDRAEARPAWEAAAKVRARLGGAGPGRLSLEEPLGPGGLSRPEGEDDTNS